MDHKFLLKWEQLYKIIANNLAAVRKGSIITLPPTLWQFWNILLIWDKSCVTPSLLWSPLRSVSMVSVQFGVSYGNNNLVVFIE